MSYLFKIEHQDTKYKVLEELSKDSLYVDIPSNIIKIHSKYIHDTIVNALNNNKAVFIPKLTLNDIDYSDIIIDDMEDNLYIEKEIAKRRAQEFIIPLRVNKTVMVYLYKMLIARNGCIDINGEIMTSNNKDDVFLNIISKASEMENETDGDKIIKILENYIDSFNKLNMLYTNMLNYLDKFNAEIDSIVVVPENEENQEMNKYSTVQDAINAVREKYIDFMHIWGV